MPGVPIDTTTQRITKAAFFKAHPARIRASSLQTANDYFHHIFCTSFAVEAELRPNDPGPGFIRIIVSFGGGYLPLTDSSQIIELRRSMHQLCPLGTVLVVEGAEGRMADD